MQIVKSRLVWEACSNHHCSLEKKKKRHLHTHTHTHTHPFSLVMISRFGIWADGFVRWVQYDLNLFDFIINPVRIFCPLSSHLLYADLFGRWKKTLGVPKKGTAQALRQSKGWLGFRVTCFGGFGGLLFCFGGGEFGRWIRRKVFLRGLMATDRCWWRIALGECSPLF